MDKDLTVFDLGFMTPLSRFEPGLTFEIHIPGGKDAGINVVINRFYRYIEFRMIRHDHVGGLAVLDERRDNLVHLAAVRFG